MKYLIIGIILTIVIGGGIVAAIIAIVRAITDISDSGHHYPSNTGSSGLFSGWFIPEYEIVGKQGEQYAAQLIKSVFREGDYLFTNVQISYDGKPAELDNVVVNKYGVFIIEIKNYKGVLFGGEDDYEWKKYKTTDAGNTYEKTVKNPIKQVKRQIYVLAKYLNYYGTNVWVKGYAILLQGNSPVESDYLLKSQAEIDRVIHTADRKTLSPDTVNSVIRLLAIEAR